MGLDRATAAWAVSLNSLAGALGGIALMRFTDRLGVISIAVMPAIAVPALLAIGLAPIAPLSAVITMGILYVFIGGSHYGIISIAGTFYPTTHRALGTGWMSGIGKLGSVLAPLLGGVLLGSGMPIQRIFAVLAVFPAIFAVCGFTIGRLERSGKLRAAACDQPFEGASILARMAANTDMHTPSFSGGMSRNSVLRTDSWIAAIWRITGSAALVRRITFAR